jgi:hypothetical protein
MPPLSNDQKIEYIYNEIKAQKRARYFKVFFRTTVFWFLLFLYFTYINWMNKQEITKIAWDKLWEIIAPIAENMVNNIINKEIKSSQQIEKKK